MGIGIKTLLLFTVFMIGTISFSCAPKQQHLLFNTGNPQPAEAVPLQKKKYLIQPQDLLQVRNLQYGNYSPQETQVSSAATSGNEAETYEVEPDSTIMLPLIGRIKVAGLSRPEAARHITNSYSRELKDPIIALKIMNLKVTLLGEIKNQGNYNLVKDETSLVEVIGSAGGLTDKGNATNIMILRGPPEDRKVLTINLGNIHTLSNPDILLQNKDIIYVARHQRAVRAEKLQSLSAILQPVITFLNTIWMVHTLTRR